MFRPIKIDFEELTNALQSLGERPSPDMVRNLIDCVDLDGSGQIDFEEFVVVRACKQASKQAQTHP